MKAEKHGQISNDAASLYKTCTGRAISKELLSAFAKGAVDEDKLNWRLSRYRNWHFYNNNRKIGRYWRGFSNERIYNEHVAKQKEMLNNKEPVTKIYEMAGRIAHHIQDMSCPSHVMPIFHTSNDKFDSYEPVSAPVYDDASICKDVDRTVVGLPELLEQAAQNTLKMVASKVVFDDGKTDENETWMKFWGGPNKRISGFREYGEYGNIFGTIPPCKSGSLYHMYSRSVFDRFYNACYTRAIIDTVRLLIYLDQHFSASSIVTAWS